MQSRLSPARVGLFKDSWKSMEIRFKASRESGAIYIPTKSPPKAGWPLIVTDLPGDITDFEALYNQCVIVRCPEAMPYPALYRVIPELAARHTKIDGTKVCFLETPAVHIARAFSTPDSMPKLLKTRVYTYFIQLGDWTPVHCFDLLTSALNSFLETSK